MLAKVIFLVSDYDAITPLGCPVPNHHHLPSLLNKSWHHGKLLTELWQGPCLLVLPTKATRIPAPMQLPRCQDCYQNK